MPEEPPDSDVSEEPQIRTFTRDPGPQVLNPREHSVDELIQLGEHRIRIEEQQSRLIQQRQAMTFLFWTYGPILAVTMVIIFFQGFHAWGFNLEQTFLNWLGGATVGEIGGLALLVYGALFPKR